MTPAKADAAEIRRALAQLVEPGAIAELRALHVPNGRYSNTVSGYYDDMDALAAAASELSDAGAGGVYITLNPVKPELLARAANRHRIAGRDEPSTGDRDVSRRRWMLIDCDPERPAGISASDAEKEAAHVRAREVMAALCALGWPEPIVADSGNGFHLLYRIDLPVDDGGLVKGMLAAIAFRHGGGGVKIDTSVHNPARIDKLYGTVARKGDSTRERPHRLSRLVYVPDDEAGILPGSVEVVPEGLLRKLATTAPKPEAPRTTSAAGSFDIGAWIAKHGLAVTGPDSWEGGRKWIFQTCPWNSAHANRAAFIVERTGGGIVAGCHHDGCQGKGWRDLRLLFEPGAYDAKKESGAAASHQDGGKEEERQQGVGLLFERIGDLLAEPEGKLDWVVEGLLAAGGFSALVAKPKVGKSTLARSIALAVARGNAVLGRETSAGRVLYLALEESRRQVKNHFRRLGATADDPIHVFVGRSPEDALLQLRLAIIELEPVLVIIDTLFRFARVRDANDYAVVTAALEPLLVAARETGAHVLAIHHSPKGDPRAAIDAALGSTAIAGTVDTMLVLRRAGTVRLLSSEQREGEPFAEEVTLEFDSHSQRVSLGPTKKEADEVQAAAAILEWLRTQREPVDEAAIHEAVDGRKMVKQRALRNLVESGQATRAGEGKKGRPYLYAIAQKPAKPEPQTPSQEFCLLTPTICREPENQNFKTAKNVTGAEDNSGSRFSASSQNNGSQNSDNGSQYSGASSAELMARMTADDGAAWEWLLDRRRDLAEAIDQAGTDEGALATALRVAIEAWEASLL